MRFYFNIPRGWKYSNTPRQVTLASGDGKAVVILMAESTTESLDSYADKLKKKLSNPRIIREGYRYVNGMNAYHTIVQSLTSEEDSSQEQQKEEVKVGISCIRKGGTVYTFFSAASLSDFSAYDYAINGTINSFNPLTSRRHLNRRPQRVFVKRVRSRQTLRNFLSASRIRSQVWNKIALINNMEPDRQLSPNQLVKVIQ
jgi:predicted Zn-dependent protease